MSKVTIRKQITQLIRDDFPYPVLQELIAEILINTKDLNNRDIDKRFEKACRAIFGNPLNQKKKSKYFPDLHRVMTIKKSSEFGQRPMSLRQACSEIAQIDILKKKKISPEKITHLEKAEIEAKTKGLYHLAKNSTEHMQKASRYEQMFFDERAMEEFFIVKQWITLWLSKYSPEFEE